MKAPHKGKMHEPAVPPKPPRSTAEHGRVKTIILRKELADGIRTARTYGRGDSYIFYGRFPDWKKLLGEAGEDLKARCSRGRTARFLDIGPGRGTYLGALIKELPSLEVHSLAPEQINPKTIRNGHGSLKNPEYLEGLRHHVGAAETYNPKKFGGLFDVIHSNIAIGFYSGPKAKTIARTAYWLNPGGTEYVTVGFHDYYLSEGRAALLANEVGELLGSGFRVESAIRKVRSELHIKDSEAIELRITRKPKPANIKTAKA